MGLCSKCLTTRLQDLFLNEASTCSLATKLSNFWGRGLLEGKGVVLMVQKSQTTTWDV